MATTPRTTNTDVGLSADAELPLLNMPVVLDELEEELEEEEPPLPWVVLDPLLLVVLDPLPLVVLDPLPWVVPDEPLPLVVLDPLEVPLPWVVADEPLPLVVADEPLP